MPHPAPAPGSTGEPLPRPAFLRDGDYSTRFLQDAWAALPRAPWTVAKALFWYATRRRVRARNHLQEVVGRRLGFSIPQYLRGPPPLPERPDFSCTALVLVRAGDRPGQVRRTLDSVPGGLPTLIVCDAEVDVSETDIRVHRLPSPAALAEMVAAGAAACETGTFLALVPPNVLLPGCTGALASAFTAGTEAVFADEVVAYPGLTLPLLKPDFDEDLLRQLDYIGPFLAARRDIFLALFRPGREDGDGFARDILLQVAAAHGDGAIGHARGPIHGRDLRSPGDPPGAASRPDVGNERLATVEDGLHARASRHRPGSPLVTVVVPTRDRPDLFGPCLDGLLDRTDYPRLEVIVADNGSREEKTLTRFAAYSRDPRVRILPVPGPFNFSRINNEAVAAARGDVVVLMNNDVEVMEAGWLRALVAEAMRPGVGAVGPKLLYPNRLVQHAGVVTGLMGGPAGHAFHLFREDHPGYLHMLQATRRCSAVTAACLAVRRETYLAHGGLDAEHFPVALNDVDFCLRLDRAGLRNLYVGEACLLHKESASRPSDWHPEQRARYDRELAAFTARWPDRLARDPWYNSGHGQANADFSVPRWTDDRWPGAPC